MSIQRIKVGPRLSKVAVHSQVAYFAGQVPQDPDAGIEGQTQQVLAQIDGLLKEVGSDKAMILQCQIFLSDIKNMDAMNVVWDRWVAPGNSPPRATVEARLANPKWLIEIVLSAAVA
ncbi:RidA family protein [Variovorax sp. PBL-E5]|uniref:RidA family protein n=1 Tax=Variovorax sp. PBL-E5 TaxID=434014 RepID=UPI001315EEDC|nr:RidA family protein [Variovorax sp. PBL-E5]VTU45361.1 Enamine/imine deaminase [Variovorax sp. PBL-E5]